MTKYVVAVLLFAGCSTVSVSRHLRLRTTAYDLGIFEQAVRGYAGLGAPVAELKGPGYHLLGDHFHPILMLLAPLYRVFPGPVTLLVAQAALLALSAIPIVGLAAERLGARAATGIGIAYGLSWGLQETAGFDFHEVCFAVPLLAFGLVSVVRERWMAAVAWTAPLVLVKEDLPATVAVIGLLVAWRGGRRLGLGLTAFGIGAGALIVLVVLPAFNPDHVYAYDSGDAGGQDPVSRLLLPGVKLTTVAWLLAPVLFLAVRSPLLLVAVPTLAWRFWSVNPNYWDTRFHYSAVLMPVVFAALLEVLPRVRLRRWVPPAAATGAVAATLVAPLPLAELTRPVTWRGDPTAAAARSVLRSIPDGAVVAADNRLAPQLTARCTVYLFPRYPAPGLAPQWIATSDTPVTSMAPLAAVRAVEQTLPGLGYVKVRAEAGVTLWRSDQVTPRTAP